jgi:hypothetical protein
MTLNNWRANYPPSGKAKLAPARKRAQIIGAWARKSVVEWLP